MKKPKKAPSRKTSNPKKNTPPEAFKGIIFDIDNVLIDTRASYLDTIRWTVEIYLTHGRVPLFEPADKEKQPHLLTSKDVHKFKLLGGFNDDWDCCYGLLVYLLTLKVKSRTVKDLKSQMDLEGFLNKTKTRPLGVQGIVKLLGRPQFVLIEKIARIFQEIYLGRDLFPHLEKKPSLYWKKKGLIHKEKRVFPPSFFKKLKDNGVKLGIATGRPRFEALYSLKSFEIFDYFDAITTMTEVKKMEREKKESLRKPHPFSLLETAERLGLKDGLIYIGDLPDDVLAANEAAKKVGIQSAAFIKLADHSALSQKELKKTGPDYLLKTTTDVRKLLLP